MLGCIPRVKLVVSVWDLTALYAFFAYIYIPASLVFCLSQQAYQPKRKFKKPDSASEADEETQVSMTLLEYGRYNAGWVESL